MKILLPIGFVLLALQGFSELIKRVALLRGIELAAEVVVEYAPARAMIRADRADSASARTPERQR